MKNTLPTLSAAAGAVRDAISAYCRTRINAGKCDEHDCEFCPISGAYDMTKQDGEPAQDEE